MHTTTITQLFNYVVCIPKDEIDFYLLDTTVLLQRLLSFVLFYHVLKTTPTFLLIWQFFMCFLRDEGSVYRLLHPGFRQP